MKASEVAPHRVACETVMISPQKPEQSAKNYDAGSPDKEQSRGQWNVPDAGTATTRKGANRAGNSVLACLPKTASMISYPIAPFSPGREPKRPDYAARVRSSAARSHSGPIISIIPKEAMGKKKGSGFESQEPTSPKVSCIGQIKLKKNRAKKPPGPRRRAPAERREDREAQDTPRTAKTSKLKKLLSMAGGGRRPPPASESFNSVADGGNCGDVAGSYPSLGQLKRFSCGRDQAALADLLKGVGLSGDGSESVPGAKIGARELQGDGFEDGSNAIVGYSGPLRLIDPLPKPATKDGPSEINLWKRRSVAPPTVLDLRRPGGFETRRPFST